MSGPTVIPNSLKIVTSVIRRAEELEKDQNRESKIVAYYCRVYVVTKGSKICGSDPEAGKFLMNQMEILEKVKPTLDVTKEQGQEICKNFAATVFNKADEEDRAGMADKATAKIYYAAGSFFDILEQFGEIDSETQEKRKYAKWKATDILNSIKLGKKPTIGGFGEDVADMSLGDDNTSMSLGNGGNGYDIPSAPVGSALPPPHLQHVISPSEIPRPPYSISPVPVPHQQYSQPPQQQQYQRPPSGQDGGGYSRPGYVPASVPSGTPVSSSDPRIKDSIELCNFAIAALKHNEINLARERLTEALRRLN